MYLTPVLEASQVVPQKKQTSPRANTAFTLRLFRCRVSGLRWPRYRTATLRVFKASDMRLVSEMSHTRHHHGQVVVFTIFNTVFVTNGTAGLDKGCNTRFVAQLNTVIKREKSIGGHN